MDKLSPIDIEQFTGSFKVTKQEENIDNYYHVFADTIHKIKNFSIGPFFWFIPNNYKMKIDAVSENVCQLTPFTKEEWLCSDPAFFSDLYHPDDQQYVLSAFNFVYYNMFPTIAPDKRKYIQINIYGRMLNADRKYRWTILQSNHTIFNASGQVVSGLSIVYDISHFQIENMPLLTIIDLNNKSMQYYKHFDQKMQKIIEVKTPHITKREKEILKLMAEGYNTPGIAKKLYISFHTVENHKRNLRKKTTTKTSSELIAYVLKYNLLSIV